MKKILKSILGPTTILKIKSFIVSKDQKEQNKLRESFYKQFVQKGDLYFDVGANLGNRIAPMLQIGAKVIAVEPQKMCIEIMRTKFGNKIEIVPMGLGELEAVKDFYLSSSHTISSFSTEWIDAVKNSRFKEHNWQKPIKVQITTLDKLIEKFGLPVFIKIDVEGYEPEVLKGLTQPIKMISFEYTVPEQTQKVLDCIDQIYKYNSHIECNYSIAESMEFALKTWTSVNDMKTHIATKAFIDTGFGDVYIRTKKLD